MSRQIAGHAAPALAGCVLKKANGECANRRTPRAARAKMAVNPLSRDSRKIWCLRTGQALSSWFSVATKIGSMTIASASLLARSADEARATDLLLVYAQRLAQWSFRSPVVEYALNEFKEFDAICNALMGLLGYLRGDLVKARCRRFKQISDLPNQFGIH
jgi:hypothetical protein